MASNLVEEIKKAVKEKAKKKPLKEADFRGDDGYSLVPDVAFDKGPGSGQEELDQEVKNVDHVNEDDEDGDAKVSGGKEPEGDEDEMKEDANRDTDNVDDDNDKMDKNKGDVQSTNEDADQDNDGDKDEDDDADDKDEKDAVKEAARKIRESRGRRLKEDGMPPQLKKALDAKKDGDKDDDKDGDKEDVKEASSMHKKMAKLRAMRKEELDDLADLEARGADCLDPDEDEDAATGEVTEDSKNRDTINVGDDNAKIQKGKGDYKDDHKHITEDEEDGDEDDKDDKEDSEAKKVEESLRKIARVEKGNFKLSEDLAAIFGSQKGLSDQFKRKTRTVFEAAVVAKTNSVLQNVIKELAADYSKTKRQLSESMVDKIDAYLDRVISVWKEENKPALESKIRTQISESFMEGLKKLFQEHYIAVPEGKEDVLERVIKENVELEQRLNREMRDNIRQARAIVKMKSNSLIKEASNGLSANQTEKLKMLAEGVDFESQEQFVRELKKLKEAYFVRKAVRRSVEEDNKTVLTEGDTKRSRSGDPEVKAVAEALGRLMKK